jgi:Zn finger protein HypA/HybF involved in hydrogenase expression
MPYFLKGNCVHKGTKEEPGELVKCHEDHGKAVAHMRALYANVEDAGDKAARIEVNGVVVEVKGGPGSGWHNPPEGTHTAENAPNFRGGPGADRKYGTESDEPPEGSKLCKCTKCNSTFTLPKGKQCKDVECPGCGGRATQTSPRRDKPAEGEGGGGAGGRGGKKALAPSGAGNVHGEGSMLGEVASVMSEDAECKCPHCKKGLPCTAKACPHCKEKLDKVDRGEGDKAVEGSLEHQMETIRQAFDEQYRPPMESPARDSSPWYWVVATFDSAVIVEHNNQFYHIWFTKVDGDYTFAPREEWTEVERRETWAEKAKAFEREMDVWLEEWSEWSVKAYA